MRRLGTFANADGLSQLLLRLTVSSTVYCLSEMSSPWGFRVGARSSPAFHLLTRSAFAERFRGATGETPIQSLTRYRLERAAEYLRTTNAGIREIARITGYDSEVSISKAFRRQFGTSPGAYRKANVSA